MRKLKLHLWLTKIRFKLAWALIYFPTSILILAILGWSYMFVRAMTLGYIKPSDKIVDQVINYFLNIDRQHRLQIEAIEQRMNLFNIIKNS